MTEEQQLAPYQVMLNQAAQQWPSTIKEAGTDLSFQIEQQFAIEAMTKNNYLFKTAQDNPDSLYAAMLKIAAVGLSLNSTSQYAYLVPRNRKVGNNYIPEVCLDISYKGLIKIATDTGSIKWAQAELVYEADTFNYKGPAEKPEHVCSPFASDRGNFVGVYCIAKTADDDFLVEIMTEKECLEIASKSEAGKKGFGPWKDFPGEMRKKAVIKRASKTWPKTERSERVQTAVDVLNEHEGIDFEAASNSLPDVEILDSMDIACQWLKQQSMDRFMDHWTRYDDRDQTWFYFNKLKTVEPPEGMRGGVTFYKDLIRKWQQEYNQ